MTGLRYRPNTSWTISSGVVYLSEAQTDNPMERGQSNTLTIGNAGVSYNDLYPGLTVSVGGTMVRYKHKGLAPLSMPAHSAFSGVDSRIATSGGSNRYTSALCLLRVVSNLSYFTPF